MHLSYHMPLDTFQLQRLSLMGLQAIQLRVGPGFPISTDDPALDEARQAADTLASKGIRVSALGFYRNMLEPERDSRAAETIRLRHVMKMAPLFGASVIGVFAGRNPSCSLADNIPLFREVWAPLVAEAEDKGLRIAFENCTMFRGDPVRSINLCHTPHAYSLMFDAIPSPSIGIEYDPSHLVKQRIDPVGFLARFPGRVFHVHAKDHRRYPEKEQELGCFSLEVSGDCFPGQGEVDFPAVLRQLAKDGYQGAICIEAEKAPGFANEEERTQGLAESARYLEFFLPR